MIEVFDENDVRECLAEVTDSDIKTYAFCLLDWAVQKRKVKAIPLDRIKQAREEIENIKPFDFLEITKQIGTNGQEMEISKKFAIAILDKLITESKE